MKKVLHGISTLFVVILSLTLLWLAVRNVNWMEAWRVFIGANFLVLALSFVCLVSSYALRSVRWQLMISDNAKLPLKVVFWATVVGYLMNNILPARAGDALRPLVVLKHTQSSRVFLLATVFVERFAEIGMLGIAAILAVPSVPNVPGWMTTATYVLASVTLIGVVLLLSASKLVDGMNKLINLVPLPANIQSTLRGGVTQVELGSQPLRRPWIAIQFMILTILIWICEVGFTFIVAQAIHIDLSILQCALLLLSLSLASIVPSTPGYVGVFQFVAVSVLVPLGVSSHAALAYIILFQACQYVSVICLGLIGAWQINVADTILQALSRSRRSAQNERELHEQRI